MRQSASRHQFAHVRFDVLTDQTVTEWNPQMVWKDGAWNIVVTQWKRGRENQSLCLVPTQKTRVHLTYYFLGSVQPNNDHISWNEKS